MKKSSPDFSKRESLKNGIVMALASIAAISRTENAFADNSIKNASTESLASNCPDIGSLKETFSHQSWSTGKCTQLLSITRYYCS